MMTDDEYKPIYKFKNYYTDSFLNDENSLNEPFYSGDIKLIKIKHKINNYHSLIYHIKNNNGSIITYKDLYNEIDTQSLNYKHILEQTDARFIENIYKQTDTYEIICGS